MRYNLQPLAYADPSDDGQPRNHDMHPLDIASVQVSDYSLRLL